jgi:hypothetical protein
VPFSRITKIIAVIVLFLGCVRLALGFTIGLELLGPRDEWGPRYLGSTSSGQAINQAVIVIAVALALGTLAEIALTLKRAHPYSEQKEPGQRVI